MQESVKKFAPFFSDLVLNAQFFEQIKKFASDVTPKIERQPADSLFS